MLEMTKRLNPKFFWLQNQNLLYSLEILYFTFANMFFSELDLKIDAQNIDKKLATVEIYLPRIPIL